APGRRELRRELRGSGARPVHPRRSGPRRRGDRALPGAPGRDHDDLSPAVAGHGSREGDALDPAPRSQSSAEVLIELGPESEPTESTAWSADVSVARWLCFAESTARRAPELLKLVRLGIGRLRNVTRNR